MTHRSVCFVIMPFGRKSDAGGQVIDFDSVYREIIAPAIEEAGLLGVRADEELSAGFIHKLMYERLILSEFAIADLTVLNANVYYELGIRHAARQASTVLVTASASRLPFDVGSLRALPYELDETGRPRDALSAKAAVFERLQHCRQHREVDSPLFDLLDGYVAHPIDHTKTDVFRQKAEYSEILKTELRAARAQGLEALDAFRDELGDIDTTEAGVAVDLLLSYRSISRWERMVELVARMNVTLAHTVMVREQLAFALNRLGQSDDAERILKEVISERGPSSETYGLLGRVYKDRWDKANKDGDAIRARGILKQAIAAYRTGFDADWRDAYPGVNALTLMALSNPSDPAINELAPVVRYAVERRIATSSTDYWDQATLLELAVIQSDLQRAEDVLPDVLALLREPWEAESTARNLSLLARARAERGDDVSQLLSLISEVQRAAKRP